MTTQSPEGLDHQSMRLPRFVYNLKVTSARLGTRTNGQVSVNVLLAMGIVSCGGASGRPSESGQVSESSSNVAPSAVIAADTSSGVAVLQINFDTIRSRDTGGSINDRIRRAQQVSLPMQRFLPGTEGSSTGCTHRASQDNTLLFMSTVDSSYYPNTFIDYHPASGWNQFKIGQTGLSEYIAPKPLDTG
jgi:hypothetical protein